VKRRGLLSQWRAEATPTITTLLVGMENALTARASA
jgi:hypothetical protein